MLRVGGGVIQSKSYTAFVVAQPEGGCTPRCKGRTPLCDLSFSPLAVEKVIMVLREMRDHNAGWRRGDRRKLGGCHVSWLLIIYASQAQPRSVNFSPP